MGCLQETVERDQIESVEPVLLGWTKEVEQEFLSYEVTYSNSWGYAKSYEAGRGMVTHYKARDGPAIRMTRRNGRGTVYFNCFDPNKFIRAFDGQAPPAQAPPQLTPMHGQQAMPTQPPPPQMAVHRNVVCDGDCGANPITGNRYTCAECSVGSFDLCEGCWRKGIHGFHCFSFIPRPGAQATVLPAMDTTQSTEYDV